VNVDITVYLPDEIGKWAKDQELNLSRMLRDAVEAELQRHLARAHSNEQSFERIEVYDSGREHDVAFQGREIGQDGDALQAAYLTPSGTIVVTDDEGTFVTFDNWTELAEPRALEVRPWPSEDLMVQIAGALGEKYVEELDI
jgi:hypothetical protein